MLSLLFLSLATIQTAPLRGYVHNQSADILVKTNNASIEEYLAVPERPNNLSQRFNNNLMLNVSNNETVVFEQITPLNKSRSFVNVADDEITLINNSWVWEDDKITPLNKSFEEMTPFNKSFEFDGKDEMTLLNKSLNIANDTFVSDVVNDTFVNIESSKNLTITLNKSFKWANMSTVPR